jgi:hypothetical protein
MPPAAKPAPQQAAAAQSKAAVQTKPARLAQPKPAAAPAAGTRTTSVSMAPTTTSPPPGVQVSCTCGKSFLAPESMRGRSGRCPACGSAIAVPALPSAEFDLLSVDPLALGGGPLAGGADPLAGPLANPLAQPAGSAQAAGSPNKWLIAGIAGGGGVLVVLILIVVAVNSMGGSKPVAQAPSDITPPGTTPSAPPVSPATSPSPSPTPSPAPPSTSTNPSSSTSTSGSPMPSPAGEATTSGAASSAAEGSQPGKANTKAPAAAPGEHSIVHLPLGLQTWHGANNAKLAGIYNFGKSENPVAQLSWMTGLLPHLGYQKEFERLKLDKDVNEKDNLQTAALLVKEFQNPLDPRQRWEGYPFGGMALTHFVGMSGVEDSRNVCAAQLPRSDPRAGVFGYQEVARPAEITDGTSQTVMVVGSGQLASPWLLGGGSTIRGAREPIFDPISGLGTKGLPAPGTVAVMADGSVRYVPTTVDPKVFRAMCTIHGAETIDLEGAAPALPIETLK